MKPRNRLIAFVLMVALCSGCAGRINQQMASWLGRSSTELVSQWGPPTETQNIGGGSRVLTWRAQNGAYRMFTVDQDGIIRSYRWQGF